MTFNSFYILKKKLSVGENNNFPVLIKTIKLISFSPNANISTSINILISCVIHSSKSPSLTLLPQHRANRRLLAPSANSKQQPAQWQLMIATPPSFTIHKQAPTTYDLMEHNHHHHCHQLVCTTFFLSVIRRWQSSAISISNHVGFHFILFAPQWPP